MDAQETVCFCMNITAGEIEEAIAGGAATVEAVQEATGAGTGCGGCIDTIQQILDEHRS